MNTKAKATQLSKISQFASPKPLDESTWYMWVDTEGARGSGAVLKLVEHLREAHTQPDPVQALFAGHSGSGKSTELFHVKREVDELYHVVIARIGDRYSLPTIDYRQLLFFCASQLVEVGAQKGAIIPGRDEAENLLAWFDDRTQEEVQSEGHKLAAEGGAQVGFFKAFFAKFSGQIYSGGETREKAIKHIESRLDQLRLNMQIIVRAIEEKLGGHKLLLVLEDLDKIEDRDQGRKLFFEHRRQLSDIPCNVIFTFPIALWYEQEGSVQNYPIRYLLPMIPVTPPPSGLYETDAAGLEKAETGIKILRRIVFRRLDENADLIAPGALDYLIKYSGGVLRDLLYMLRESAVGAKINNRSCIEINDAREAARSLRDEYTNRLVPRTDGETRVMLKEIEEVLGNPDDWPKEKEIVDQTEAFKMLLQSLCILEYNGQRWLDLHPAVREHLEIRSAKQRARKTKKTRPASSRKG
jgi:hypothetical protein